MAGDGERNGSGRGARLRRWLLRGLGYACLGLGAAGAFLPLLPTTPFLLVAVWAFASTDPALVARIERSPLFGPPLATWRRERAIPIGAKRAALGSMAAAALLILFLDTPWLVKALVLGILATVAIFIATRPRPAGTGQKAQRDRSDG
ncbi:MAG TPA: YbaN family protein [Azospirillaceae bacterium]|nr:YbaN family protein [Azospirillaceae bacterium]